MREISLYFHPKVAYISFKLCTVHLESCWGSGNKTRLSGVETRVIEIVVLLKELNNGRLS